MTAFINQLSDRMLSFVVPKATAAAARCSCSCDWANPISCRNCKRCYRCVDCTAGGNCTHCKDANACC